MAIVKIVSPSGWDFDCQIACLVKVASDGRLHANDRRSFIKRASGSENVFLPFMDRVKFAKDEVPMHLIALGALEAYGPNRNGDGFREAALKKYHNTFEKFARYYRSHRNKDPKISYGVIKCSAYNPAMRRVELLIGLNAEKSAVDRNGGFLADRELEKLAKGEDIPVSMACRVPFDECSYCGNKARTRDEYCKAASCKAGGCYDNLTKLVKVGNDVHHLFVHNDQPSFFDISTVFRPADRTAYGSKADWIKAAADGGFFGIGGAKLAADMGVTAPLSVVLSQDTMLPGEWQPHIADQIKLAYGLSALEHAEHLQLHHETKRAFTADVQPEMDLTSLGIGDDMKKTAAALGALADQKILLPLRDFARMTKRSELLEDTVPLLPGVYSRMIADGSLERRLTHNKYAPAEKLASAEQRRIVARMASVYSLEKEAVDRRCTVSALRAHRSPDSKSIFEKKASNISPLAEELARDYACYKVAALRRIASFDNEFLLTCRLNACQNAVV